MIRDVRDSDRDAILDFCKNTFSWGDYVDLVWDHWLEEKNLLCAYDESIPVGICHALVSERTGHVWIEGIRIRPEYRRRRMASELVLRCEQIGIRNHCNTSMMLIEESNMGSLYLAAKLGYKMDSAWVFYSIRRAAGRASNVRTMSPGDNLQGPLESWFVDSWRWNPLDDFISELLDGGRVIHSSNSGLGSIATVIPSAHFDSTCLVTLLRADRAGADEIIPFLQHYGTQNNVSHMHLLANQNIDLNHTDAQKMLVFHLMKRRLDS